MSIRQDLMAVAAALAAEARRETVPPPADQTTQAIANITRLTGVAPDGTDAPPSPAKAAEWAAAAKVALEAAALADDIGPGEINQALGDIHAELEAAGVLADSLALEPAEFLRRTFQAVKHWRGQADRAHLLAEAYSGLHNTLTRLERDFTTADSEVSRRVAARIHTALETADQTINHAAMPPTTRS